LQKSDSHSVAVLFLYDYYIFCNMSTYCWDIYSEYFA
jgi:hypothetical protein